MMESKFTLEVWDKPRLYSKFSYDVTSGVDQEFGVVMKNLSALLNVRKLLFKNTNADEITDELTQRFIANVIFAWFWAMGVSTKQVESRLTQLAGGAKGTEIVEWLSKMNPETEVTKPTLFPVPSYIDVKMTYKANTVLFGDTREAALYTYQVKLPSDQQVTWRC